MFFGIRALGALAILSAILALPLRAAPPSSARDLDPKKLAGTRFYEAKVAEQIRLGTLKLWEYSDGVPWMLSFPKAGALHLEYGQEDDHCTFASEKGKSAESWTLELACGFGKRTATLEWTGPGRLKTDKLFGTREQTVVELVRDDRPFAKIIAQIEVDRSKRELPKLDGKWVAEGAVREEKGAVLEVESKKGTAKFEGIRHAARALECAPLEEEDASGWAYCLELAGAEEKGVLLRPVAGAKPPALVEVSLATEGVTEGRRVTKKPGARTFTRVEKKGK